MQCETLCCSLHHLEVLHSFSYLIYEAKKIVLCITNKSTHINKFHVHLTRNIHSQPGEKFEISKPFIQTASRGYKYVVKI